MFTVETDAARQAQDFASIELYLDGVEDGFKGIKPTSHTWEYLRGYSEGCRRKANDLREQAQRLEEDASAVERRANGATFSLDKDGQPYFEGSVGSMNSRVVEGCPSLSRDFAGEPDWMDEILQDNDEPTLIYDCMIEEF